MDVDRIARELLELLKTANPKKPFAAALYSLPDERMVAQGINKELEDGPIAHAELNVLMEEATVTELARVKDQSSHEQLCLFVSTRPCPMCTAAIVEAGLFDVRFFYENNYRIDTTRAIIGAKRNAGRPFTFREIDSHWKDIFGAISEGNCRNLAQAVEHALANKGALDPDLLKEAPEADRAKPKVTSDVLQQVARIVGYENPKEGIPESLGFCIEYGHPIKLEKGQQYFPCDHCSAQKTERALVFRKEARFRIDVEAARVYHYSAGGAVFCQFDGEEFQRVLLLRGTTHPVGVYSTPAGHWDLGEDAQIAAEREIEEETGLSADRLVLDSELTDSGAPTLIEEECRCGSDYHYWRFFIFKCSPRAAEAKVGSHSESKRKIGEADIVGWVPVPEILAGKFVLLKPVGYFLGKYLAAEIPNVLSR